MIKSIKLNYKKNYVNIILSIYIEASVRRF